MNRTSGQFSTLRIINLEHNNHAKSNWDREGRKYVCESFNKFFFKILGFSANISTCIFYFNTEAFLLIVRQINHSYVFRKYSKQLIKSPTSWSNTHSVPRDAIALVQQQDALIHGHQVYGGVRVTGHSNPHWLTGLGARVRQTDRDLKLQKMPVSYPHARQRWTFQNFTKKAYLFLIWIAAIKAQFWYIEKWYMYTECISFNNFKHSLRLAIIPWPIHSTFFFFLNFETFS